MTTFHPDIVQMRQAAHAREWNMLQDTLKRVLALLDPLIGLEVAAQRMQDFLPRFEHYYPEAGWVRQLALTVVAYASAPNELPQHAVNQFPSPGCGNFVSAVLDMARVVQTGVSIYERYSFITNAIANTILADLMDFYYSQHPEEWEHLIAEAEVIDPETGLTVAQQMYFRFWSDASVAQRDTALWLSVVDMLALKLDEAYQ